MFFRSEDVEVRIGRETFYRPARVTYADAYTAIVEISGKGSVAVPQSAVSGDDAFLADGTTIRRKHLTA